MAETRLILVGGFLGAGKTTLLARAASRLASQGHRVGLITNDQATHLVDTAILKQPGSAVQEVSGGCFCCRFDNLIGALKELMSTVEPDIVIAEPVGSCTDLSATVLQPLKAIYGELFRLAPFSVLVDPVRLGESLGAEARSRFPANVLHIFRTQLDEADLIVLNKADTLAPPKRMELEALVAEHFPWAPVLAVSALRGDGVEAWLEEVLADRPAGRRLAEVDYEAYAEGEAELGWLNASVALRAEGAGWRSFCEAFMAALQAECRAASAEIAHVKLLLTAGVGSLAANLTRTDGEPTIRGEVAGAAPEATLLVNARVRIGPEALRGIFERSLAAAAGPRVATAVAQVESFAPARPRPTHRYGSVV